MSSDQSHWRELITQSGFSCPKLFYKFTSDDHGYKLLFTDIVGLWSEALNSESIHELAKKQHTSIDPSQSKKQFHVLLQKLEQSLSSGTNNLYHDKNSEDESIVINTTTTLPKPLQPLKWRFHLKPEASSEMAEHILRPSLHEASESRKKLDSLLEVIDQKDHVISRLLERIDNSSLDLSLIFPRISRLESKNGIVTSKEAQTQVPGLGKFNRGTWNEKFRSDSAYTGFQAHGLANLMAGCEKCPRHTAKKHEQWLRKLPTAPLEVDTRKDHVASNDLGEGTNTSSDSDSDNFETQRRKRSYDQALAVEPTPYDSDTLKNRSAKQLKLDRSQPTLSRQKYPVVPTESLHEQRRDSNASTASNDSEDLDLPPLKSDGGRITRLGQLGNKSNSKAADPPMGLSTSRDDIMAKVLLPLSSSSPPPQAPKSSARQIPDNKQFGSSSPTTSSLNTSTPRKLGRLKSQRMSNSATPEKSPAQHDPTTSNREASILMTPTRRLGRLGASRGTSQAQSQALSQSQHRISNRAAGKDIGEQSDSDASTSSTTSEKPASAGRQGRVAPRLLHQESSVEFDTQAHGAVNGGVKVEEQADIAEDKPELTKEEKAIYRRQELQKKIGPSRGAAQTVRKRRKF